jgi:DNA-binding transcriptional MerR regulator
VTSNVTAAWEAIMSETEPETYTIEQAAESLDVSADDVRAYIEEGLVAVEADAAQGPVLSRAAMRRLWSVVTLHRDLDINLPGVSAVLRLREQYEQVRRDLATLVEIVERELGPDVWDRLWPEDRPTPHANVQVESMADEPPPPGRAVSEGGVQDAGAQDESAEAAAPSDEAGGPSPPNEDADT